jgi:hypothetical protein
MEGIMKRLCDVCRGVYANNHSFKEHQRKTGHRQFVSNNAGLRNADGDNRSTRQFSYELKDKNDRISSLRDSIENKDGELGNVHDELKEAFATIIADVAMIRPVIAKHYASLGEDNSFETTHNILKPAVNYLLDLSHKFGIVWNEKQVY